MKYVVTTQNSRLNVRSLPDLSAPVLRRLPKGTLVDVDPRETRGIWRKLVPGGWVSGDYLRPVSATDSTPIMPPPPVHSPLPNLETMWKTYPRETPEEVKRKLGGGVNVAWIKNTCTIRLSFAFNAAGHPIPHGLAGLHTVAGADGHWYAFRVLEMRNYIEHRYGPAKYHVQGSEARTQLVGKKGIIMYDVPGWSSATGHFDMWNGRKGCYEEFFAEAREVLLWS